MRERSASEVRAYPRCALLLGAKNRLFVEPVEDRGCDVCLVWGSGSMGGGSRQVVLEPLHWRSRIE